MLVSVILTVKCTEHRVIRERCVYLIFLSVIVTVKFTEYRV